MSSQSVFHVHNTSHLGTYPGQACAPRARKHISLKGLVTGIIAAGRLVGRPLLSRDGKSGSRVPTPSPIKAPRRMLVALVSPPREGPYSTYRKFHPLASPATSEASRYKRASTPTSVDLPPIRLFSKDDGWPTMRESRSRGQVIGFS